MQLEQFEDRVLMNAEPSIQLDAVVNTTDSDPTSVSENPPLEGTTADYVSAWLVVGIAATSLVGGFSGLMGMSILSNSNYTPGNCRYGLIGLGISGASYSLMTGFLIAIFNPFISFANDDAKIASITAAFGGLGVSVCLPILAMGAIGAYSSVNLNFRPIPR